MTRESRVLVDAVARTVNEAARSLRAIREWCDKTEADTTAWMVEHNPMCECEVGQTRLEDVAAVRALLPDVPPAVEEEPPCATTATSDPKT